ncbi:RING-H2 finger protein ATL5 (RING-type E3 ubiquitin transferase ATL5) [Durusdinium trenchii]|uniref:RING-H2 finger protein ATL5 (RING-type E3 ubiquitin transferase ATL5) n=1 Tax=Durusdinium trenchii TaxID=1381693 RepID=A0ABP0R068_9DINO
MLRRRTVAQGATCVALALAILSMSSVNEFDGFTWDMIALTASVILDTWDILFLHLLCIFTEDRMEVEVNEVPPRPQSIQLEKRHEGEQCSICLNCFEEEAVQLPCGHIFHSECIGGWLRFRSQCPLRCHTAKTAETGREPFFNAVLPGQVLEDSP